MSRDDVPWARRWWSAGLLVPAGAAQAAGETVTTTAKVKGAKLVYKTTIAKADGSRPANMSGASLPLPSGRRARTRKGFATCPLATIQANDVTSCPSGSVAGKNSRPDQRVAGVRDAARRHRASRTSPGLKNGLPTFATYYTVTQFPSAHSISTVRFKKAGGRWAFTFTMPKLPIAPGPARRDAAVARRYDLAAKVLKGKCKAASLTSKVTFHDGSSATDALKSSC